MTMFAILKSLKGGIPPFSPVGLGLDLGRKKGGLFPQAWLQSYPERDRIFPGCESGDSNLERAFSGSPPSYLLHMNHAEQYGGRQADQQCCPEGKWRLPNDSERSFPRKFGDSLKHQKSKRVPFDTMEPRTDWPRAPSWHGLPVNRHLVPGKSHAWHPAGRKGQGRGCLGQEVSLLAEEAGWPQGWSGPKKTRLGLHTQLHPGCPISELME